MKYLVTGSKGQLGREFVRYINLNGLDYAEADIDDFDIANIGQANRLVKAAKPDIIINCAAYNEVDKAEDDKARAFAVNSTGVKNLVETCREFDSYIIHFSSDYVYSGEKKGALYNENDEPKPLNQYGWSKLEGEKALLESTDGAVFRLSWVYGRGRQNFPRKLLEWAQNRNTLDIAFDEVSIPTYTGTIVTAVMKAANKRAPGLYCLANSGYASRYEWAKKILEFSGLKRILYPVSRKSFGLKAERPFFSAMSNELISSLINIDIPDWEYDLKAFIKS